VCEGQYRVDDAMGTPPMGGTAGGQDRRHGKTRSETLTGAIREGCPAAAVVTADSKGVEADRKADGTQAGDAAVKQP
jgi:hypothetical protein